MTSALRFRNPPPGPPHDPKWMLISGRDGGWPMAAASTGVAVSPVDCALTLQGLPSGGKALADPSGRFGGLVPPPNVAVDDDGAVWLLDRVRGRLRRFDDCACAFVEVPCTGGLGSGARELNTPLALAARGADLIVLDGGAATGRAGRILVFTRRGFALRAVLAPPASAVPAAWRPSALAVDPRGRVFVADVANGALHLFDRGGTWRQAFTGFGAVSALAIDRLGRIYTYVPGDAQVRVSGPDGALIAWVGEVEAVCDCFSPAADLVSVPSGAINLAGRCAGAGWFDPAGKPAAPPTPAPLFPPSGTWMSTALDSAIGQCPWHRVVLEAALPAGAAVTISTYTAETLLPIELVAALPASVWSPTPLNGGDEALILSPPGRYLWIAAALKGDTNSTPRLCRLRIEYPRISLRRYLPRAFAPDPVSADFTDRLLAVFDQGFRSVEGQIDREADLFDPRSAPAVSATPGKPDMLSWLASWVGVTFDRGWPVARRRRFLMQAAGLYRRRGTTPGLRRALALLLGLDEIRPARHPARCAPPCAPAPPPWSPPPLVLEHWKIRRWLYLGAGRLGDAAVLWGEAIMGRSQLGVSAQAGVTRLDTTRQPVADPFNAQAYAFTVFAPVGLVPTAREQATLRRMLDAERPAWTEAVLRIVRPRMRIGIQASIGFDSVVGCWPEGVRLDEARLGRATVLSSGGISDPGPRVGRSQIGSGARLA